MPRRCPSSAAPLTPDERAIVAELRRCADSPLAAYPVDEPLPLTSVAWVLGITEGEAGRLLAAGLRHIAAAIGRDPELLELVSDYYTPIPHHEYT